MIFYHHLAPFKKKKEQIKWLWFLRRKVKKNDGERLITILLFKKKEQKMIHKKGYFELLFKFDFNTCVSKLLNFISSYLTFKKKSNLNVNARKKK